MWFNWVLSHAWTNGFFWDEKNSVNFNGNKPFVGIINQRFLRKYAIIDGNMKRNLNALGICRILFDENSDFEKFP